MLMDAIRRSGSILALCLVACSTAGQSDAAEPTRSVLAPIDSLADCHQTVEQVSLWEWVEAADAVVVGRVAGLRGVLDPARLYEDGVYSLVPQEKCRIVHGVLELTLDEVEVLSGDAPERIAIRFSDNMGWTSEPVVLPDGSVVWPDQAAGVIDVGMRIGGALFRLNGASYYTFMSYQFQPIFEVDSSNLVRFQEFNRACVRHIGPIDYLDGLALGSLLSALDAAALEAPERPRADNRLRVALGIDDNPDRVHAFHHGHCAKEIVPHRETCSVDGDCPTGQICGETWECVDHG